MIRGFQVGDCAYVIGDMPHAPGDTMVRLVTRASKVAEDGTQTLQFGAREIRTVRHKAAE